MTIRMPATLRPHGAARSRADYDAARARAKPSRTWYQTAAWKKRRARQLAMEPVCRYCRRQGIVTRASVADHVEPHREDPEMFWHGELQSLCASCHSEVKQREEQGR